MSKASAAKTSPETPEDLSLRNSDIAAGKLLRNRGPDDGRPEQWADPDDGIPEHIKALYDQPQEEWGADEWRILALYLSDELQRANATAHSANATARHALDLAEERSTWLDVANWMLARSRKPKKPPGRPKKDRSAESVVREHRELIELAAKLGPTKAAEVLAEKQLVARGERLPHNRTKYRRYAKTWANKISAARRMELIWLYETHGPGLAFVGALLAAGLSARRRRRKT